MNNNEKIRVGKLLLEVSIQELHNDLIAKPPMGLVESYNIKEKYLINDTAFNALMPPHVKKIV